MGRPAFHCISYVLLTKLYAGTTAIENDPDEFDIFGRRVAAIDSPLHGPIIVAVCTGQGSTLGSCSTVEDVY